MILAIAITLKKMIRSKRKSDNPQSAYAISKIPITSNANEAMIAMTSANTLFIFSILLLYTKRVKTFKYLLLAVFYGLLAYAFFIFRMYEDITRLGYLLLAFIMPFIPMIIERFIKIPVIAVIIYDIFVLLAMILGNIYGFYRFKYFDTFLHFTSGILIATLVYVIYNFLKGDSKINNTKEFTMTALFVEGVNMLIAFLWELFEFMLLVFFDNDAINHYTEGVYDTMIDMTVCFIGGLIIIIFIYHYYKTKKKNIVIRTSDRFLS